jgi:hypothetical protein
LFFQCGFYFPELENVWEMKRLLDGKVIMSVLGLKIGGPVVKQWVSGVHIFLL